MRFCFLVFFHSFSLFTSSVNDKQDEIPHRSIKGIPFSRRPTICVKYGSQKQLQSKTENRLSKTGLHIDEWWPLPSYDRDLLRTLEWNTNILKQTIRKRMSFYSFDLYLDPMTLITQTWSRFIFILEKKFLGLATQKIHPEQTDRQAWVRL